MLKYQIVIEGRNFLLKLDQKTEKYGFYTTRFLEAIDGKIAVNNALNLLRDEISDIVLNQKTNKNKC